ncbi:hypothetical protein JCM14469_09860 [Desulfatiferula olefinivorans]
MQHPMQSDDQLEKRQSKRKTCRYLPVDFVFDQRLQRGVIADISRGGARIENTLSLPAGGTTTMTFMENHDKGPVKTTCRVVRACDDGFAVEFDALTSFQADAIATFVDES